MTERTDAARAGLCMPLGEAMETQRAIRRLHPDPVDDALIVRLVELAQKAPQGGDVQRWECLVVKDPARRSALARLNRSGWPALRRFYARRARRDERFARMLTAVKWQADHLHEVPVIIVVCHVGLLPPWPPFLAGGHYGSVFPAVQNLLLAARAMGLGAALTTLALSSVIRARRVLDLPRRVTPVAVIPIGWPIGRYGPTTRTPVGEVLHVDRWGHRPFLETVHASSDACSPRAAEDRGARARTAPAVASVQATDHHDSA